MGGWLSDGALRRKVKRHFFEDGLNEVRTGIGALFAAALLFASDLAGDNVWREALAMAAVAAVYLLYAWWSPRAIRHLRETVSYPRLGYAQESKPRRLEGPEQREAILWIVIAVAFVVLLDAVTGPEVGLVEATYFLLALTLMSGGWTTGLTRMYVEGAVLLLTAAWFASMPGSATHLQFAAFGLLVAGGGVLTFLRLARTHPPLVEDADHVG